VKRHHFYPYQQMEKASSAKVLFIYPFDAYATPKCKYCHTPILSWSVLCFLEQSPGGYHLALDPEHEADEKQNFLEIKNPKQNPMSPLKMLCK
jgi:hypothetical protein